MVRTASSLKRSVLGSETYCDWMRFITSCRRFMPGTVSVTTISFFFFPKSPLKSWAWAGAAREKTMRSRIARFILIGYLFIKVATTAVARGLEMRKQVVWSGSRRENTSTVTSSPGMVSVKNSMAKRKGAG